MSLLFRRRETIRLEDCDRQLSQVVGLSTPRCPLNETSDASGRRSGLNPTSGRAAVKGRIRTRPITDSDREAVACLLVHGFRRSTRQDWLDVFARLATHPTPDGFPTYGHMMESDGVPVAVILLVSSNMPTSDQGPARCNLSTWYVTPGYRIYGHLFMSRILQRSDVTYLNVSPAPHTLRLLQFQGFSRYSNGQFLAAAVPLMRLRDRRVSISPVTDAASEHAGKGEHQLLLDHAQYGCISLWCVADGQAHPFVFRRRLIKGCVPCAQLIYCRDRQELVRFFGPIGRHLAKRGMPLVMMDSNGPVSGLIGIHAKGMLPKYYKGGVQPRLGDLAYTETALFGI